MIIMRERTIERVRALSDPLTRAVEAQTLIERARQTIAEAQEIRDEAMREAHRQGGRTRAEIADQVGTTVSVVVSALREK